MKENLGKVNSKKKYAIAVLLCVLVLFVVVLILSKKNSKEGDVMAIYVQEEETDYIFTSQDDGLSWADGKVPAFFMTTQKKEIRRDGEEMTVTIQNKSEDVVMYGSSFSLYRWSENTWVPYDEMKPSEQDFVFNDRGYLLQPNDSNDMKCYLQYYDFKRGKYLLRKEVSWEKDDSKWDLSVEFVVD